MIRNIFFGLLVASMMLTAQSTAPNGSINGIVQDVGSGSPIAGAQIFVSPGGKSANTDEKGHYEIKDLASRKYQVQVSSGVGPHGRKIVQLASGQDLTVDFRLSPKASISGRIVDENGEPTPGVEVFLIAREYRLGALRYVYAGVSATDDRGRYELKNIEAGPGYLIEAAKRNRKLNPISDVPADPKLRRKTTVPTWYPDSDSVEAAQVMVLQPGEHREGMDIQLKRSASYCLDGVLATDSGPAPLIFSLEEREPSSGASGDGAMFVSPPQGMAGPDGRIRLCDLHSGV
ncbi:MAG: carboxypeptidase regulatory-like domain-containing protein, partial [Acidobacteriota bacterium]|nr:carboxypeptidase regulatory-like domain-containing protein [Acidobacteriota bacterium]